MRKRIRADAVTVAIDIGTTKICVLIAHNTDTPEWNIIGTGTATSRGLERGCIINVQETVAAIQKAVKEAEASAGCRIESAYIGISGAHIRAVNSTGIASVKRGEIYEHDVSRVIESAKTLPLDDGEHILHAIAQEYIIDGHYRAQNPVGMQGVRLEAHVHIITGGVSFVHNLIQCCSLAGVKAQDIILEPLASADAVLSEDEQAIGTGLLDIGGGTADFAIYYNNTIRHTRIFPIGGTLFTNDIAVCLRTTRKEAERLKCTYGAVLANASHADLVVRGIDGQTMNTVSSQALQEILHARACELLYMVHEELTYNVPYDLRPAGLVLTGGGSLLGGLDLLSNAKIGIPCRLGVPQLHEQIDSTFAQPTYATGYGLLVHVLKQQHKKTLDQLPGSLTTRIFWKMKSWLADFL